VHEGTVYCIMSVEETGVHKTTVALSITIFRLFKIQLTNYYIDTGNTVSINADQQLFQLLECHVG